MAVKLITTSIAKKRVEKILNTAPTIQTIIRWCKDYGIGFMIGGRWKIDPEKLNDFLKGKLNEENQE